MGKTWYMLWLCAVMLFMLIRQPIPAAACSCFMEPSIEEGFSRSQVVFSGEVIAIKENRELLGGDGKSVVFNVKETWKGANESEMVVLTGNRESDCGAEFIVGRAYLVYANLSDTYEEQSLSTSICSPTKELANASEDLVVLGQSQSQSQSPIHDVDATDEKKQTFFMIGGPVFGVGLLALFGWTRLNHQKSS